MRTLLSLILLTSLSVPALRAQPGQLDGHETLFTVLAAINAAGYDADLDSPANHPLRKQVRDYLASQDIPSIQKLRTFFREHRQDGWTAELSQYVSFALLVDGPPTFEFRSLTYLVPPDAQALEGLGPLLTQFYGEADIHNLYQKVQPAFEKAAARYHHPVSAAVFELNGYLRNPTSGVNRKSFSVVLSLLAAPNQIHSRSYDNSHYIVLTPSPEPQIRDIRYAYLHYLLEQTVTDNQEQMERIRPLGDYALGAPYLADHYKQDFLLLATASLIKAVEARLEPVSAEERQAIVDKAYRQGFILAPAFYEQLPVYEKQDRAMRFYFEDLIAGVDLLKEEARAQTLEFDQTKPIRKAKQVAVKEPPEVEKTLTAAEDAYRDRKLDEARDLFLQVVRETDDKTLKGRAYFGLARAATLRNDPGLAQTLFQRALENTPPPADKAWALVYLGRLSDLSGEPERAIEYYRSALAVEGVTETAREMAEKGARGGFRRPKHEEY